MENQEPNETPTSRYSLKTFLIIFIPLFMLGWTLSILLKPDSQPTLSPTATGAETAAVVEEAEAAGEIALTVLAPSAGVFQVEVVNGSDAEVTFPQVLVDDAYWYYKAEPSNIVPAQGTAIFTIEYPWVAGELHVVRLITSRGATFDGEIVPSLETASAETIQ